MCFKNVPGVLKRMHKIIFFSGEGGDFGVFGAPTPPSGGRAGSENDTLLPMTMTCERSGPAVRLGGQKLSSGNLGGGRIQNKNKNKIKILTKP